MFSGSAAAFVPPDRVSLIVSSCRASEGLCKTRELVAYKFENGRYIGKVRIAASQKLNFSNRLNQIYKNRFAIDSSGSVVDVKNQRILFRSNGDLFRLDGDRILLRVAGDSGYGLYSFNLENLNYRREIRFSPLMSHGVLSPNGIWSAWERGMGGIEISQLGGTELIQGDFEVAVNGNPNVSSQVRLPLHWLSDDVLITQRENGKLVLVDTRNMRITSLVTIPIKSVPNGNPFFSLDENGQLTYWCGEYYLIDPANKTYKTRATSARNGFRIVNEGESGRRFFFQEDDIGVVWSIEDRTIPGYVATLYGKPQSNLGYPDGVMVWNSTAREWVAIPIDWGAHLVGWISE